MQDRKLRVLVVDDSVFARKVVCDIIESSPELDVAGVACNGREALALAEKLRPNVITLDVEMPGLNGLETLKRLMAEHPTPVVMLSSLTTEKARESMLALSLGAVDVVAKPHGTHGLGLGVLADELIAKITAASKAKLKNLSPVVGSALPKKPPRIIPSTNAFPVVIIASSTGGPRALRAVIPGLVDDPRAAWIVVQHLPVGFSGPMAQDLNALTGLEVMEAAEGHILRPGEMIVARSGYHCVVRQGGRISVTDEPPLWGVRPAADITIASAIPIYGGRLVGVVLTGMGRDGSDGIRLIKEAGGSTLAEHESSCVVYGMPRAAVETGAVDVVAPLEKMAEAVNAVVTKNAERMAA